MIREEDGIQVEIPVGNSRLAGNLFLPEGADRCVIFAHGSGSSRFSPRNRRIAKLLFQSGIGSFLTDLLTASEDAVPELRFDIPLLTDRLVEITRSVNAIHAMDSVRLSYFGASTGAAAALLAAGRLPELVRAVVCRGGRTDLAGELVSRVRAATLLIVGEMDQPLIPINNQTYRLLRCKKEIVFIPGATHLFEEPGKLDEVGRLTAQWVLTNGG
ncbi:MAG: dienelactone hydrolase family protein [Bacteroidota bacterium]|jgi:pimeloyl-ACP methyl ester carboxylesterase|uniref:dienelactone hydrolase family protein n=1 Tax=Candidatus Pollutiaquabacter sp. TaxID=3416354 RepID=UPI001A538BCB|nr:alpha/beta hydrolase [Bacteroidota bacterium]MBL7948063.1 alpha/beta hydrolase [Bacteroidia bacterium]HRU59953.1 alpha/beta hydrolase [Bacteroidia bacterium]